MKNVLCNIRKPSLGNRNKKYLSLLLCILFGILIGTAAKYFDNTPIIGELGTNLGIWIFLATLISCYSLDPILAGINVFFFFLSMLFAYYTYTYFIFQFLPISYIQIWICLTVIGFFLAIIIWYGKELGWIPAFISSLPILFLVTEGIPFIYTGNFALLFDCIFAMVLYICFSSSWTQALRLFCYNLIEVCILIFFKFINIF